ncbi:MULTISPECIES: polyprenyl diphosphate synthase [Thermomonas]|jgi:undecaprenyl diphosphate synthase|uniref:Ditrans,polycis-undecaprenyl-diphosphate synthase ((2E,6E)-farnesyl-diphosphate specific) n=1 Tax=Thermomonas beijingensis TaxID=2872701 RepID=A0ABS7TC33_9GAMM|nr:MULTISPECIES: polyprenyl diphosphate synthase [Thermomonas]MBS0459435.1 di-trans,poly-cis-decaprenylcistransferase [Pseudomonadota bacterium]MBZ4185404.1 di-trans,poly-cis-decaprenylcistransferase [Thermomonas beijingensis]HOC10819.1 polyprenyl diphosphate synthase [Thermomonas sp.]HQA01578.1 polyprenyl diphosphate synthase [Thermomonas sp.]HQE06851.1 polyprenyl diphosphate synthase [Thermomonas sp.]
MPTRAAPLPHHIAIIMDGNGRWAQRRHRPRIIGHRAGAQAVKRCVEFCLQRGIEALTLFAFSSENWNRPSEEVGGLMKLFLGALEREVDELHRLGARLRFIGERSRFDPAIQARMHAAEALTASNPKLQLTIAASYGGRQDIVHAARLLAEDVAAGRLLPEQIDESALSAQMALADLPAPDLFIRTGGELRISNFLLWQMAYTELWFTDTLWPDVDAQMLQQAVDDFATRERRFGLTSAQLRAPHPGNTP